MSTTHEVGRRSTGRADGGSPGGGRGPTNTLRVPVDVLEAAGSLFEEAGSRGCEATAMIAAGGADGVRLVVPNQAALPAGTGASVRVTRSGQLELAGALTASETYVVRIHSHPVLAFHSAADDANPVLTHEGALSIVVPYFGLGLRRGLDACAVLRFDRGWHDLPPGPGRDRWLLADARETHR